MDDKAKTAMEISDIGTISKTISHWSFINDGKIPDGLDSLIDEAGNMYHTMPAEYEGTTMANVTPMSNSGKGLTGPMGYTAMAEVAPKEVLSALASAGLSHVYIHRVDEDVTSANDSTFETNMMGAEVNTENTVRTLDADAGGYSQAQAQYLVDNASTLRGGPFPLTVNGADIGTDEGSLTFATLTALNTAIEAANAIVNGETLNRLCFIYPGGGAQMSMGPMSVTMPMNLTDEIISNCGLTPDQVADPTASYQDELEDGKRYYLVVMGLGRFASINDGKAVRLENPAYGKRQDQNDTIYSRYLVVIKVPLENANSMTNVGEGASVAAVLSPQGYSAAALRDNYIDDEAKLKD